MAAYAEAVSDGVADELRRRLFRAIWVQGRHLSSAYEVRRLITAVMWPQEDITDRLASPDIPSLLLRDPDMARIVRRSGGTIAPDGGPLTTAGWRRIRQWRQEWLALPSQVIPAVIGPDQVVRPGIDGLALPSRSRRHRRPAAAPARACRNRAGPGRPACGDRPGGLTRLRSTDMAGGGPARTWHAALGKAGLDRARAPVTARVSCALRAAGSDGAGSKTGPASHCALNFYYDY